MCFSNLLTIFNFTAQLTVAILGMPLSSKHDSFRNKHMLQDGVHAQKKKEAPAGLQWNGMLIFSFFIFGTYCRVTGVVD